MSETNQQEPEDTRTGVS